MFYIVGVKVYITLNHSLPYGALNICSTKYRNKKMMVSGSRKMCGYVTKTYTFECHHLYVDLNYVKALK